MVGKPSRTVARHEAIMDSLYRDGNLSWSPDRPGHSGQLQYGHQQTGIEAAMNTFALLTFVGTMGVIISFLSGARAMTRHNGSLGEKTSVAWRVAFGLTVLIIILAAPLSS